MSNPRKVFVGGAVVAGLAAMLAGSVTAGMIAPSVEKKLRGQLVLTDAVLSTGGLKHKAALNAIKAANKKELKAVKKEGGVSYYAFHWTGFLRKKPRTNSLSLEFYKKEGKKFASGMSASKGLTGVNPGITILRGHTEITEDDGVTTGKTYKIKLVATIGNKDHLLASTVVTFK